MDFLDYMICLAMACIIEAMLGQIYYVFYARKIYRIVDNYRMAPDNDMISAAYKKLTNRIFNPVSAFIRVICYVFGFVCLFAFTVTIYHLLGI